MEELKSIKDIHHGLFNILNNELSSLINEIQEHKEKILLELFKDTDSIDQLEIMSYHGSLKVDSPINKKDFIVDHLKAINKLANPLLITKAEFVSSTLKELIAKLSKELSNQLICVLFVSPPRAEGLSYHVDSMNTLIIPLHGKKKWYFAKSSKDEYFYSMASLSQAQSNHLDRLDFYEVSSDTPFLFTRGLAHKVENDTDQISIHLSIGVYDYNNRFIISQILDQLEYSSKNLADPKSLFAHIEKEISKLNFEDVNKEAYKTYKKNIKEFKDTGMITLKNSSNIVVGKK